MALDPATRELEFLRQVAVDFGLKVELPVPMLQDNLSTIRIVESGRFSSRTRHLNVRCHYTHDLVKDGVVRIQKIDTKFIPSDALTKKRPSDRKTTRGTLWCCWAWLRSRGCDKIGVEPYLIRDRPRRYARGTAQATVRDHSRTVGDRMCSSR